MKILETSRNIMNQDEVDTMIAALVDDSPNLTAWLTTVLRKWILRKAPAVPSVVGDDAGLPVWLRTTIQRGDEMVQIDITAISERVRPVVDYMVELVHNKPDTKIAQIGFEVAEARATKWHADMAKTRQEQVILEEEGVTVVQTFPDGYTWRNVFGKEALNREGDNMGHCVGRFNYWSQVIRAKVVIVSLRDEANASHVTIEIKGDSIEQIKGKANAPVVAKYLPYVLAFLKTRTWKAVNFDGARSLAEEFKQHHQNTSEPVFSFGKFSLVTTIDLNYSNYESLLVVNASDRSFVCRVRTIGVGTDSENWRTLSAVDSVPSDKSTEIAEFAAHLALEGPFKTLPRFLESTEAPQLAKWDAQVKGTAYMWATPANVYARALIKATYPYEMAAVCIALDSTIGAPGSILAGATSDQRIVLRNGVFRPDIWTPIILTLRPTTAVEILMMDNTDDGSGHPSQMVDYTVEMRKKLAGVSIVEQQHDDTALLNSLLTALKQPDVAAVKATYKTLKTHSEIKDNDFRQHGFPTGGRSINSIGLVLVSSLSLKNKLPFQRYVFNKPHAFNNFCEVLTQPGHMHTALKAYGLDDDSLIAVTLLLRNEYLRLLPSEAEMKAADFGADIEMRLRQVHKHIGSLHSNKARSKAIWGVA
jgi:hypothetical protein